MNASVYPIVMIWTVEVSVHDAVITICVHDFYEMLTQFSLFMLIFPSEGDIVER